LFEILFVESKLVASNHSTYLFVSDALLSSKLLQISFSKMHCPHFSKDMMAASLLIDFWTYHEDSLLCIVRIVAIVAESRDLINAISLKSSNSC